MNRTKVVNEWIVKAPKHKYTHIYTYTEYPTGWKSEIMYRWLSENFINRSIHPGELKSWPGTIKFRTKWKGKKSCSNLFKNMFESVFFFLSVNRKLYIRKWAIRKIGAHKDTLYFGWKITHLLFFTPSFSLSIIIANRNWDMMDTCLPFMEQYFQQNTEFTRQHIKSYHKHSTIVCSSLNHRFNPVELPAYYMYTCLMRSKRWFQFSLYIFFFGWICAASDTQMLLIWMQIIFTAKNQYRYIGSAIFNQFSLVVHDLSIKSYTCLSVTDLYSEEEIE